MEIISEKAVVFNIKSVHICIKNLKTILSKGQIKILSIYSLSNIRKKVSIIEVVIKGNVEYIVISLF